MSDDRDFPIESGSFTHHYGHEGTCRHFDQSACDCDPREILKEIREGAAEITAALAKMEEIVAQEASVFDPRDDYWRRNSVNIAKLRFVLGYNRILSRTARMAVEKVVAGEVLGS